MQTKTTYETGLEQGIRYAWIESLDWVLGVLNDEIEYQEESISGTTQAASALYRIRNIASHRRKEWMLYEPS